MVVVVVGGVVVVVTTISWRRRFFQRFSNISFLKKPKLSNLECRLRILSNSTTFGWGGRSRNALIQSARLPTHITSREGNLGVIRIRWVIILFFFLLSSVCKFSTDMRERERERV